MPKFGNSNGNFHKTKDQLYNKLSKTIPSYFQMIWQRNLSRSNAKKKCDVAIFEGLGYNVSINKGFRISSLTL
jgi:hypothetical protein